MPAPSVLVVFTDADGDEFPVRVQTWHGRTNDALISEGSAWAQSLIDQGEIRPTLPLAFDHIERI